jgi:hypothetical protein
MKVNGKYCYEHGVYQEPMRHEHNNRKNTELADGPLSKESDTTQYDIICKHFESIRATRATETDSNSFFDWQGDGSGDDLLDLDQTAIV